MDPYSYSYDQKKQPPVPMQQIGTMTYAVPSQEQHMPPMDDGDNYGAIHEQQYPIDSSNDYFSQRQEYNHVSLDEEQGHEQQTEQYQEPTVITPMTPEEQRKIRFTILSMLLFLLNAFVVLGCVIWIIYKAFDSTGVLRIASIVIYSIIDFVVVVICLIGMASTLLNRPGQEQKRYKTAYINLIGLSALLLLNILWLVLSNVFIPLVGIVNIVVGLIVDLIFYGPCLFVAGYRFLLLRKMTPPPASNNNQETLPQ
jgi:predicted nucleic acid-binding Zn ribbon protein